MANPQMPKSLSRILKVSLILMTIAAFSVVLFGTALSSVNTDVKMLRKYLANAETTQPNFEQSLILYTEKTKDIIDYLLELRPENEDEYVEFISKLEEIGSELKLNLKIRAFEDPINAKNQVPEKTLVYDIDFYGSALNLSAFLNKLETLPYFIKVHFISYKNPTLLEEEEEIAENVKVRVILYTK